MGVNFATNTIIAQRYRLISVLGKGSHATTYQALDTKNNKEVALKILTWQAIQEWKSWELLERESMVLAKLDHPNIPKYIDFFGDEQQQQQIFVLVQELAPGKSLGEWVKEGWRTSEAEVKDIAQQVLEIFKYLHNLTPPVIHRDIKPQNLLRTQEGKLYLVDFGSVQNTHYSTMMRGSTVVGTYGYMAPEQFIGKSLPQTDLYGLGATLLFLLTHCEPGAFSNDNLKVDLEDSINVSPQLLWWLEKLLAANVDNRFQSPEEALLALNKPKIGKARALFTKKTGIGVAVGIIALSLLGVGATSVLNKFDEIFDERFDERLSRRTVTVPQQFCSSQELVKEYISQGRSPNVVITFRAYEIPLISCWLDNTEMVKLLIENGVNVNNSDTYGSTPVHSATYHNNTEIAKLLIENGADVNARNKYNNTPLYLATVNNYIEIAKMLIENGADVNARNKYKNTPLHGATYHNNTEIAKLLIENGADIYVKDRYGRTPCSYDLLKNSQYCN